MEKTVLKKEKAAEIKYRLKYIEIKVSIPDEAALGSPEIVFDSLKDSFNPMQEELYFFALNSKNRVLKRVMLARGGIDEVSSSPTDLFRQVILVGGSRFILAHNHPSFSCVPSENDIQFTDRIRKASKLVGLDFLDHVIFTNSEFYSFKRAGHFK